MKKIILALLILLPFLVRAQSAGNDTAKYIYYRFTYGNRLARYWADTVLMIPKDTIWSKDGIALKAGVLMVGDGTMWHAATGGGGGSDSGFQVLQASLTGGVPIAKFVDGSGHRFILYDTSGSHPGAITTNAGAQKKIDSLRAVIGTLLSAKFGLTDTGYTHLLASVFLLQKVTDSMKAVNDARYMANLGGAPGWLVGALSAIPAATTMTTGTHYTAADVGQIFVDTGTGGSRGWKQISGAGAGADSAIWKNSASYIGTQNLTMNGFTQILSADGSGFGDPTKTIIVFMGTSITHGIQDTTSDTTNRWTDRVINMLSKYGPYTEMNLGVPGTLLATQIPNIPTKTSGMVLLVAEFGSNELAFSGEDSASFRADWVSFMAAAASKGWAYNQIMLISQQGSQLNACGTEAQQRAYNFVDSTVALTYGAYYADLYNPLVLPQYSYVSNIDVANIHPPVDAVQLFANIVFGAISRILQYQNMTQQLLVKDTAQIGALVIKNAHYIPTPRIAAFDEKGNVGVTDQLPANIRTQGILALGGGMIGYGPYGKQNFTISPIFDPSRDWQMGYQGKIVQWAQTAVPYSSYFQPMFSDGESYFVNYNPAGVFHVTVFNTIWNGTVAFQNATSFGGALNVSNQVITSDPTGNGNDILLSENGTKDTWFKNKHIGGKSIGTVSANYTEGAEFPSWTQFADGSWAWALVLPGDTIPYLPASELTAYGGIAHNQGTTLNPLMTNAQIAAIASPNMGLHAFSTDDSVDMVYNGSAWVPEGGGSTASFGTLVQEATTVNIPLVGSNSVNLPLATSTNAGLLDSGRAATVDSLRNRTITGFGGSSAFGHLWSQTASGPSLTNTTTVTSILGTTSVGSLSIAGSSLYVGEELVLHGFMSVSTKTGSTLGFSMSPQFAGNGFGTTVPCPPALGSATYEVTARYIILATGSSGSIEGSISIVPNGSGTPANPPTIVISTTPISVNLSGTVSFGLNAQWGEVSTSDIIQTWPPFTLTAQ